ncbi:hypothetical protein [Streptomyces sp. XH2]|uniref:hypothetical protein n=1 Tax=Streptomyces sp. XH2 TaxID=3412483 RepID=UPI003C7C0E37
MTLSTPWGLGGMDRALIESDIDQGLKILETHEVDDSLLDLATRLRMHINRLSLLARAHALRVKRGLAKGVWVGPQNHARKSLELLAVQIEAAMSVEAAEQYVHDLAQNAQDLLDSLPGGSDAHAAAVEWLSAALAPHGRNEWLRDQPAHCMTGVRFDAIQIPQELLSATASADGRREVEARYKEVGIDSAVISDPLHRYHYVLVPPGSACAWHHAAFPCFGPSHSIAVPAPHRGEPPGVHWLLNPPDGPGALCEVERVLELLAHVNGI